MVDPDTWNYSIYNAQSYENQLRLHNGLEPALVEDQHFLNTVQTLAARCPKCGAPARRWCRLPNGRLMGALHLDRFLARVRRGTLEVPSVARDLATPVIPRSPTSILYVGRADDALVDFAWSLGYRLDVREG